MKFEISRASQGPVSKGPPIEGAIRGPESKVWPGEYQWLVEIPTLDDLMTLLKANGGGLSLFAPEEDEEYPALQILDDDEEDE